LPHGNFFRITSFKAEILALAGVDMTKPVEIILKTKYGEVKQKFEFFIKKTVAKIKYYIDEEKNLGIFTMAEDAMNEVYKLIKK
jgi:hypothetical protein